MVIVGVGSKSYVVVLPRNDTVRASALPTKLSQARSPNPVTMRSEPPVMFVERRASGSASRSTESGATLTPGPVPAVPKSEYQQPPDASQVCHEPTATAGCGFSGQKVES